MLTVALFGEAQKGAFQTGYLCQSLEELANALGEPPSKESQGLDFAVQALLYQRNVLYFRVREEGFSIQDYEIGFKLLENQREFAKIAAICLPGVGNAELINGVSPLCHAFKSHLVVTHKDLYDYLTH